MISTMTRGGFVAKPNRDGTYLGEIVVVGNESWMWMGTDWRRATDPEQIPMRVVDPDDDVE
jgi:hypothetical protein